MSLTRIACSSCAYVLQGCTLDAALDLDIVERKGSWYAYKGNNLAQGRQNVVDLLKQDADLAAQLVTEVRLTLSELGSSDKATRTTPSETNERYDEETTEVEATMDAELYFD